MLHLLATRLPSPDSISSRLEQSQEHFVEGHSALQETGVTVSGIMFRRAASYAQVRSSPLLHEAPDDLRDLIRCGIEREMTRIEDMDFGVRHVPAISLRFRKLERQVVFAPEIEKPSLLLAHPSLPLGVGVDVGAVV